LKKILQLINTTTEKDTITKKVITTKDVSVNRLKYYTGPFADYIILIALSKMGMDHLLERTPTWTLTNKMNFGINKCTKFTVKPILIG